jgi:hypothetical protein
MARRGRGRRTHRGGEGGNGRPMSGGMAAYNTEGAPLMKSNYSTISGGKRRSRRGSRRGSRRSRKGMKGGNGVLATAALPFGLLALQRYFSGSKTAKRGVANMGRSVKRTFRRKH